jgi:hypothetical protein
MKNRWPGRKSIVGFATSSTLSAWKFGDLDIAPGKGGVSAPVPQPQQVPQHCEPSPQLLPQFLKRHPERTAMEEVLNPGRQSWCS